MAVLMSLHADEVLVLPTFVVQHTKKKNSASTNSASTISSSVNSGGIMCEFPAGQKTIMKVSPTSVISTSVNYLMPHSYHSVSVCLVSPLATVLLCHLFLCRIIQTFFWRVELEKNSEWCSYLLGSVSDMNIIVHLEQIDILQLLYICL